MENTIDSHPEINSHNANQQIISDDVMLYVEISITITLQMIIAAVGLITNVINTVIFSKLGLQDSMSVGLFSLSITDFFVSGIQTGSCIFCILDMAYLSLNPKAWFMGNMFLGWAGNSAMSISSWITAIVSVERCLCVASPFKVKHIFTRCRCAMAILTVYMFHLLIGLVYISLKLKGIDYRPLLAFINTSCEVVVSECTITFPSETASFLAVVDLVFAVSVSVLLQAVVLVSAVWMGISLQVTSRVRHKFSNLTSHTSMSSSVKQSSTSNRERRLVKVVFCLAITLSICNAPQIFAAFVYHLVSGLSSEEEQNLSTTLWSVTQTIGSLGCSSSFLVYFTLNRNYRQLFRKLFR